MVKLVIAVAMQVGDDTSGKITWTVAFMLVTLPCRTAAAPDHRRSIWVARLLRHTMAITGITGEHYLIGKRPAIPNTPENAQLFPLTRFPSR